MTKRVVSALLCLLFITCAFSACGTPAPDFTVVDENEQPMSLSDLHGKPVVVNFWATWCPPCVYELPYFDEAVETYGEDVSFMMINVDGDGLSDISTALSFMQTNGYDFPVYFDLAYEASYAYGVSSIPMTLWIDRNGHLVHSHTGIVEADYLEHYIQEILK